MNESSTSVVGELIDYYTKGYSQFIYYQLVLMLEIHDKSEFNMVW